MIWTGNKEGVSAEPSQVSHTNSGAALLQDLARYKNIRTVRKGHSILPFKSDTFQLFLEDSRRSQATRGIKSLKEVLGLPRGLLLVNGA